MNNKNLGNTDISHESRLPFSQACENNKDAILEVLKTELAGYSHVLEVGSGTGQHSVYFAPNLPHLIWQTSDVVSNHSYIKAWHNTRPAINLRAPLAFDLTYDLIPLTDDIQDSYDAVFTANTFHIISWSLVQTLVELVGTVLPINGKLIVYGPFNENGRYTSESNQRFDLLLKQRDAASGIRNKEDVLALANQYYLQLSSQYDMPANNQILVFQKSVQA